VSAAGDAAAGLALEIEALLPGVTGFLPLPNAVDAECSRLVELYVASTPAERADIRDAGTLEQYRVFLTFCDRMVVLAVRSKDEGLLFQSLVAHAIEDFRWDPRENLMRLSLVRRSAEKLGVDDRALFRRVAAMASPVAARYLSEQPLAIEAMGFSEYDGPDGFLYRRSW